MPLPLLHLVTTLLFIIESLVLVLAVGFFFADCFSFGIFYMSVCSSSFLDGNKAMKGDTYTSYGACS